MAVLGLRKTVALVAGFIISALLLANWLDYAHLPYAPWPRPHHTEDQIRMSEGYYDLALGERQNLIKKWGPTVERVVSFPRNGEHYTLCA